MIPSPQLFIRHISYVLPLRPCHPLSSPYDYLISSRDGLLNKKSIRIMKKLPPKALSGSKPSNHSIKETSAAFEKCKFGLIASLAYPNASKEIVRTGCDLMNAFFVFDDISDGQSSDDVRREADVILDSLRNPYDSRPQGESILGDIFRTLTGSG
ncbi:hypothetical protein SISSUDRAFT_74111 [Sistotremastrum suecicum HHB10207 ss-3]|uniref:Terpenoid synthase n=1 Tax=Sistotremastrum suecicum HHB10207 ss-3 TaxID=1314776 RepID=A0A166BEM0_9AGAM|nr:hypothetical protein SISSUDRAFT_74111 [Sistotremastrum suecicum HHB10207 ss-3]